MKYFDADKLIAEIERLQCEQGFDTGEAERAYQMAIKDILAFIDSLQQEQPEVGLEKEIEMAFDKIGYPESFNDFNRLARHFYELGRNARKEE